MGDSGAHSDAHPTSLSLIHQGDIVSLLESVAEKVCPFEFVFLLVRRRGLRLSCLGLRRRWHRHGETQKHHDDEYWQD